MKNKAQMKLSFGMIFSIFLIIIFLAFGIYAIKNFLGMQSDVQTAQFANGLQSEIDKLWKGSQGSQVLKYSLPKKISSVCIVNDDYENLIFRTSNYEYVEGRLLKNIDVEKILGNSNEFCIDTVKGKIQLTIKKSYGEALVYITE